ncbi:MAG: hypothetical protein ACOC5T_02040 [Elusimicrobiota bacterium]
MNKQEVNNWVGGLSERPDFDTLYMTLCLVLAQRSMDPNTAHGSFLIHADKTVLSCGYNGPIRGSLDEEIPIKRPEKYAHMIHSEENCMLSYYGSREDLKGSIMYVSGSPCHRCMRKMLQKGVRNFVLGTIGSCSCNEEDEKAKKIMLKNKDVNIKQFTEDDMNRVMQLLDRTKKYILHKREETFKNSS